MIYKQKNIHESISKLIEQKIAKHVKSRFDSTTCSAIYVDIFDALVNVFQTANLQITNEAVNLLSQMYYDSVSINGNDELDPNIFDKRAKLENVATKELSLLASMYRGTPFFEIFVYEINKRS